jgi:hypothetical protein
MASPPHKAVKLRRKSRTRPPVRPSNRTELELWALLCNSDERKLALAKKNLDRKSRTGLRHFSALRRAVPLQQLREAQQEIYEMDRQVGLDEVFSIKPPRKWERKSVNG